MEIRFEKQTAKYLERTSDPTFSRLNKAIARLEELDGDIKKMAGSANEYRLRVGDIRVLFEIRGEFIVITKIASRGEVYKN